MRAWSKIGIAAALLLVAVAAQPARAACSAPYGIDSQGEHLISNPNWTPGYYYAVNVGPAVTPNIRGNFWALTGGDPTIGLGNDNGVLPIEFPPDPAFAAFEGYVYQGNTYYVVRNINGGNPLSWQPAQVDGCIDLTGDLTDAWDTNQCTCMLVSDVWGNQGYYMIVSAFTNPVTRNYSVITGDNDYNTLPGRGDMILSPVPKPQIIGSSGDASGKILNIVADGPSIDNVDPCGCHLGYKVFGVVQPTGSMAPPRDLANWTELQSAAGTAQQAVALGSPTSVRVDCGAGQQAYLTTALVFDSGYRGTYVSSDSIRVNCDPTVADPQRPDRPGKPLGDLPDSRPRPRGDSRGR